MKDGRGRRFLAGGLLLASLLVLARGALAQTAGQAASTCSEEGIRSLSVSVDDPDDGQAVDGTVDIAGVARSAPLSSVEVARVEVRVDGHLVGVVQPAETSRTVAFSVRWDSSSLPGGPATIRVLACGERSWGAATREVEVVAEPSPTTTARSGSTTTAPPLSTTTSTAPGTETTVPVIAAEDTTTSTTSTTAPTTTTSRPPVIADAGALAPLRAAPAPASLQAANRDEVGPPLYPAVSAGLAGLAGIVWMLSRREDQRAQSPASP